jgi:DNA processing protein
MLCVVGSRKASSYGEHACRELIRGLAGAPVTIISGLALGIDAIAHAAALDAGLHTIAVPGSGLDRRVLYPRSNIGLADRILESGGALVSELEPTTRASKWSFPNRNRLMAGMSHAVLVVEAGERSGTLITARLGLEYGRDVCAVPGSIFSETSAGAHDLIRDGARPITSSDDLRDVLDLDPTDTEAAHTPDDLPPVEADIYDLLREAHTRDELIRASSFSSNEVTVAVTQLELKGVIRQSRGVLCRAR